MALPRNTVEVKVDLQIENLAVCNEYNLDLFTKNLNNFFKEGWLVKKLKINYKKQQFFALLFRNKPKDESKLS